MRYITKNKELMNDKKEIEYIVYDENAFVKITTTVVNAKQLGFQFTNILHFDEMHGKR